MKRPIIHIPKTGSEWLWDVVGCLFFVGSLLFLVFAWNKLPDEVPAHYNALGEVDRWGSKWELLLLPGIGVFIIFLMQILEKHPELHNYPARFTELNAESFYLHSRKIVNQIKNSCLIIFSVILLESISIALGWGGGFGKWLLPITIIGMITLLVIGIVKQKKIQ